MSIWLYAIKSTKESEISLLTGQNSFYCLFVGGKGVNVENSDDTNMSYLT